MSCASSPPAAPTARSHGAIEQRYGGAADSLDLEFPPDTPMGLRREVLADIQRIPHRFAGFNT